MPKYRVDINIFDINILPQKEYYAFSRVKRLEID